ncbi:MULTISPECIES: CDP-alcohol phosphatidyltransferase family protein [Thermomonospora]|uniref:CDP-alcohol phosphatidyltransferase n=1 Tax=Thermomonospora curvata (strain ATCC 19995 / DSM 43183 / JCM 3096 / KCTC 9072 / NBRC 15933 / NCIMB 10081 / Henssen B9) TaxID=471852 RepID=D1AF90_THECD|nr:MULTISPECIES: CDP-alcohol phosphatidyltransferase family protein [Thermomonospora]ACY99634.1 CDP-alcohol phosphatidyltransferase [Thermomonospora curvata DSM 43183]PKK12659.1 MAG: transferase [Thermomonospora sp. CIF 1]
MSAPTEAEVRSRRTATVADVRAHGQPPGLKERRNEEHWAGRLYMRSLSPYVSWAALRMGFSPNHLTYLMMLVGVAAGVVVSLPGHPLWAALAGALLVQVYLLLDCVDGEVARYLQRTSATGVYLDRIGHYLAEAALLVGLGARAQGEWASGGYLELGLVAALGAVLIKAETDNVVVARAKSGLPVVPALGERALRPRSTGLALARQAASAAGVHRIIGAVELSLLIALTGVLDVLIGGHTPVTTRVLTGLVAAVAVVQTLLHLISVVASRRLR